MKKNDKDKESLANELKKANEEIQRLKDIISEKDLEVSFVVHDLKNPLSVIEMNFSLISGVLEDHEEFAKLSRVSSLIESQILSMKHLIHELLNISKMENAKLKLELSDIQVEQLLETIVEENGAVSENNGMTLRTSLAEGLGTLSVDQHLLRRVFSNLIVNAIKYSVDSEDIILHVLKADKPNYVRFIVEDFGAGIPKGNLDKVFNKFEHSKSKDPTKRVSHGLGLYFCKLVLELHGSEIKVESKLNKGSKFIFDLPCKPSSI